MIEDAMSASHQWVDFKELRSKSALPRGLGLLSRAIEG